MIGKIIRAIRFMLSFDRDELLDPMEIGDWSNNVNRIRSQQLREGYTPCYSNRTMNVDTKYCTVCMHSNTCMR